MWFYPLRPSWLFGHPPSTLMERLRTFKSMRMGHYSQPHPLLRSTSIGRLLVQACTTWMFEQPTILELHLVHHSRSLSTRPTTISRIASRSMEIRSPSLAPTRARAVSPESQIPPAIRVGFPSGGLGRRLQRPSHYDRHLDLQLW